MTVLTSGWKTVPLNGRRPFGLFKKLVGQMRLKPHAEPTRAEVVLCGLFTTSKSLESLRAQNVKSPLSAIFVPERLSGAIGPKISLRLISWRRAIPFVIVAKLALPHRGFVLCSFSDAGSRACGETVVGPASEKLNRSGLMHRSKSHS